MSSSDQDRAEQTTDGLPGLDPGSPPAASPQDNLIALFPPIRATLLILVSPLLVCGLAYGLFTGGGPFAWIVYGHSGAGLGRLAEARLVPPSGQAIGPRGSYDGRRYDVFNEVHALTIQTFGSSLSRAEVDAFYAAQLRQRGWRDCYHDGRQLPLRWCKGNLEWHIEWSDIKGLSPDEYQRATAQYKTLWQVDVEARPRFP